MRGPVAVCTIVSTCLAVLVLGALTSRPPRAEASPPHAPEAAPIGLSLFFQDGTVPPVTLGTDAPRYLQELDIVVNTPPSAIDEGIEPLIQAGEFASLDWRDVAMVEEDWRSTGDGFFQRQRFYRGARWMERPSHFRLIPADAQGRPVGPPITAHAGRDNRWLPSDDGFVRRFVVRQVARNCPAIGDTSGATFTVQGLVQFRDALHPDQARAIPCRATQLLLVWTAQPGTTRAVPLLRAPEGGSPVGHGFQIELALAGPPSNGTYFLPGETVPVRVVFRDGAGNPLFPDGVLPSYGNFLRAEVESTRGLQYYDGFRLNPTLYYALKHRESNLIVTLSGPTDKLKVPTQVFDPAGFLAGQAEIATVPADGYSAVATTMPPPAILFGGLFDPAVWELPASDLVSLTIPGDALPGTYVVAVKARRDFQGEALNRASTLSIQVGSPNPTSFTPIVGNCNTCHTGPSSFGNVLHGVTDFRACYACHAELTVEPDALLDLRVHFIHDRSDRYRSVGGDVRQCDQCHLTPPTGPAKGLLSWP